MTGYPNFPESFRRQNQNIYIFDYINIIKVIEMISVKVKVREWGRSLGVVLPKEAANEQGIKKDDTITLLIGKKSSALKETFGAFKFKRTTDEILKESDEEAWHE